VAYSFDGSHAITGSRDKTVRVWDLATGQSTVLEGHTDFVTQVAYSPDDEAMLSLGLSGTLRIWPLGDGASASSSETAWYTNAKVVLVGESQAGKSGLARRLVVGQWEPTESTVGAWATQMLLPHDGAPADEQREIWLWDFGGQADQRLVHQLYLRDTALAVVVFDGQRDDPFGHLRDWTRDVTAAAGDVPRVLVAARTDINPVRPSNADLEQFRKDTGYQRYLATSAKNDEGCDDLRHAIVEGIDWSKVERRASTELFHRLRTAILALKDSGRALISAKDLRDRLLVEIGEFSAEQLDAVVGLMAGPGSVMPLGFGDWVLLQPELLNTYAQAVIYTIRADPAELGHIREDRVLTGDLQYPTELARLPEDQERVILHAMHNQLVQRELCYRDHDQKGQRPTLLVFPSYYRRDRPDGPGELKVIVTYRFSGLVDLLYASLVTRLHLSDAFETVDLWANAADFAGPTGGRSGIRLTRQKDGRGAIEIGYHAGAPPIVEQVLFTGYIHDHLQRAAHDVERVRVYRCPACDTAIDSVVTQKRLTAGRMDVRCNLCDDSDPIALLDEMEAKYGDPDIRARIQRERDAAQIVLDNEDKARLLVGEVQAVVAGAGQIAREIQVSDWGLDMEVEFKDDAGRATGQRVWLQLKSGDSHLRHRKRDDTMRFRLTPRHADYWADQGDSVYLVVRDGEGRIETMEVREHLRRLRTTGPWPPPDLEFVGERFDVMCVRRWWQKALGTTQP
jgi:GTPase SAR1 family protein